MQHSAILYELHRQRIAELERKAELAWRLDHAQVESTPRDRRRMGLSLLWRRRTPELARGTC